MGVVGVGGVHEGREIMDVIVAREVGHRGATNRTPGGATPAGDEDEAMRVRTDPEEDKQANTEAGVMAWTEMVAGRTTPPKMPWREHLEWSSQVMPAYTVVHLIYQCIVSVITHWNDSPFCWSNRTWDVRTVLAKRQGHRA